MANSSGLNERPSRTSLRGVATLYQGSIAILLGPLHTGEQAGRRLFQAREVGIGHGREAALSGVHPVADAVGDDHVTRKRERLHVSLGLIERALDPSPQPLGLD